MRCICFQSSSNLAKWYKILAKPKIPLWTRTKHRLSPCLKRRNLGLRSRLKPRLRSLPTGRNRVMWLLIRTQPWSIHSSRIPADPSMPWTSRHHRRRQLMKNSMSICRMISLYSVLIPQISCRWAQNIWSCKRMVGSLTLTTSMRKSSTSQHPMEREKCQIM